jgi:hypothetical protein
MKSFRFGIIYFATLAAAFASDRPFSEIVAAIRKADYEGDRPTLQQLYRELDPASLSGEGASPVRYWRGFALWRRAINGFNESTDPKELESDLHLAITEFREATTLRPASVEAKIGTISCMGFLLFLHRKDPERVQQVMQELGPLTQEIRAAAPDNPRLAWVLGGGYWYMGAERGGGEEKAINTYQQALPLAHKQWTENSDPFEPRWGEPELLMSLAWSYLNRSTPDLPKAEDHARAALKLVPNWHYVRDILLAQIAQARAKSAAR